MIWYLFQEDKSGEVDAARFRRWHQEGQEAVETVNVGRDKD